MGTKGPLATAFEGSTTLVDQSRGDDVLGARVPEHPVEGER